MGRPHQRILSTDQNSQKQQRSHERHDLAPKAQDRSNWDSLEGYFVSTKLQQPARTTTPITTTTTTQPTEHEQATHTTEVQDQDEGGANDDDDTLLIVS